MRVLQTLALPLGYRAGEESMRKKMISKTAKYVY